MKKIICVFLVVLLCFSLLGCTGIFGGNNTRNLGEYLYTATDGEKEFFKHEYEWRNGYIEIGENSFKLGNEKIDESSLKWLTNGTRIIFTGEANNSFGNSFRSEKGYEYLEAKLFEKLDGCECFEVKIFEKNGSIYGAVNCYKRASGRSGNLLSNEDLKNSYLLEVENEEIKLTKDLGKTAVLAVNQSHYIAYSDKTVYSVDKETDQKIKICDDIWWEGIIGDFGYMDVKFSDEFFVIIANRSTTQLEDFDTLIVGSINGERVETLIDDQKRKY